MGELVRVGNPDKVLYPEAGFTKAEVVAYYDSVAAQLVPHLRGRALTLRRYPDGVGAQSFFEKRCPSHRPAWVHTVAVGRSSGPPYDACSVDDPETLRWVANLAALELHPSLARASNPDHPTAMVFDLDPGAPAAMAQCAEVGCMLRGLLDRLGLDARAKTSGSKGLQVYVPLDGSTDFATSKLLAHTLGLLLEKQLPSLVVTSMAKRLRTGKVLIDWGQNDRAKTTVSVYSLRALARPTVSTPVHWEEVESAVGADGDVLRFEAGEVLERVEREGDLFADLLGTGQALPVAVRRLLRG